MGYSTQEEGQGAGTILECSRCGGSSPLSATRYRGNRGVFKACCVDCEPDILAQKKRAVERVAKWRQHKADLRDYRNREARKRRETHGEKVRQYSKEWYHANRDKMLEYHSEYRKEHPEINRVSAKKRRVHLKQRIVPWSDTGAIKDFYRDCPAGMVVDHIIPLKGKHVSGLHVLANLQYLTFEDNANKGTKVPF